VEVQTQTEGDKETVIVVLIEPKVFRNIDSTVKEVGGHTEVVQHVVKPDNGDNF